MTTHERAESPSKPPVQASELHPAPNANPTAADYDRRYYKSGLGPPYDESEPHWTHFFGAVADGIVRQLAPRTVLDAGCATGFLVAALAERGVDSAGVDISDYAIDSAVSGARGRLKVQSLTEPLNGRWDLIVCIEVLEHMPSEDIQTAIDNLCACTDTILFSSTPHDFLEPSHINVQPVARWIAWFAQRGFFRRTDLDTSFLSPWAAVLQKSDPTIVDLAFAYESELAPLREELVTKRSALLDANRQIGELREHAAAGRGLLLDSDKEFESKERVLSLIDEVIGLQTELAELRYQHDRELDIVVREKLRLESSIADLTARAEASEARVEEVLASRSWRIGQTVIRPLHLFRRRLSPTR
jgi:SAM-dependent methyltransferase